jgi:hypothetical protein
MMMTIFIGIPAAAGAEAGADSGEGEDGDVLSFAAIDTSSNRMLKTSLSGTVKRGNDECASSETFHISRLTSHESLATNVKFAMAMPSA